MGNRSSSSENAGAPPPLLSAAVTGDAATFRSLWKRDNHDDTTQDRQGNNVLHALFSCRSGGRPDEILKQIHESLSSSSLVTLYEAQNQLGCTPIWILIAYGNVKILQIVLELANDPLRAILPALAEQPNYQGDSPVLATCSLGNLEMIQFLANNKHDLVQDMSTLMVQGNQKGTTPLQIVIANGHLGILKYIFQSDSFSRDQLWQQNAAGLSLFHICSERNFCDGLQVLLEYIIGTSQDEDYCMKKVLSLVDKNGANALHVACFCGNAEAIKVWIQHISAVEILDCVDGQERTAYWIAMVQGHEETIGKDLAAAGVKTDGPPKMLIEIEQARQRRAAKQTNQSPAIDGNALLKR